MISSISHQYPINISSISNQYLINISLYIPYIYIYYTKTRRHGNPKHSIYTLIYVCRLYIYICIYIYMYIYIYICTYNMYSWTIHICIFYRCFAVKLWPLHECFAPSSFGSINGCDDCRSWANGLAIAAAWPPENGKMTKQMGKRGKMT